MTFIKETARPNDKAEYTPEAMAQIVTALFAKIHPLAVGAIEQSYALAKLIGKRCLETHMTSPEEMAKIDGLVNKLCDDYMSHAYPICRKEAKLIGLKVVDATEAVSQAMMALLQFYLARDIGLPKGGSPLSQGQKIKLKIAWLDSADKHMCVVQDTLAEKDNKLRALGDRWIPY